MVQAKLAAAYHRNKDLDEADTWFQKAVKGAGEDAPAAWYVALGQIETERGNLEQARRDYIVAVQLHRTRLLPITTSGMCCSSSSD